MGYPHPLHHKWSSSFMLSATRSDQGRLNPQSMFIHSPVLLHWGFLFGFGGLGTKRRNFYV